MFASIQIHCLLYFSQGLEYLRFSGTFWPTPKTGKLEWKKIFKFPKYQHKKNFISLFQSTLFRSGFIVFRVCFKWFYISSPFFPDRNLLVLLYNCTLYIKFHVMFLLTSQRMNQISGTSYWAFLSIMLQNLSKWNLIIFIHFYISECYKFGQKVIFVNFNAVNLSRNV